MGCFSPWWTSLSAGSTPLAPPGTGRPQKEMLKGLTTAVHNLSVVIHTCVPSARGQLLTRLVDKRGSVLLGDVSEQKRSYFGSCSKTEWIIGLLLPIYFQSNAKLFKIACLLIGFPPHASQEKCLPSVLPPLLIKSSGFFPPFRSPPPVQCIFPLRQ